MDSLRIFYKYRIIPSVNRDSFSSSFPVCMLLLSFSCLIALVRISSTMLNSSGEYEHPYLIPNFVEKLSIFHPEYDVRCGFFINVLYHTEEV